MNLVWKFLTIVYDLAIGGTIGTGIFLSAGSVRNASLSVCLDVEDLTKGVGHLFGGSWQYIALLRRCWALYLHGRHNLVCILGLCHPSHESN